MNIFKKLTIIHRGLRYKLLLAFCLMSIIPLLASTYVISTYLFPQIEPMSAVSAVLIASVIVAILGLILAKTLIDPVIDMAIEAKIMANGEYDKKLPVSGDDEIGNLALSINTMTEKIRTNLDELKNYGQRMREINVDINKKVLALSSLLQIGDMISAGSLKLDSMLDMIVEKSSMIFDAGYSALYIPMPDGREYAVKTSYNLDNGVLKSLTIKKGGKGILDKVIEERTVYVLDRGTKASKESEELKAAYCVKNILAFPLYSGRNNLGLFIVGNKADNFKFKTDDIEMSKVFAKQITIAIENDILTRKTEELSIKDDLTDLYNKNFIVARLEEEIKRSIFYQRPCSFIVLNVDNFKSFRDEFGELTAEEVLNRMARLIRDNIPPVGKAARIGVDEFAVLIPETNKKEAGELAEELRRKVESAPLVRAGKKGLTVSSGISENPIDGATGDELYKKAQANLRQAKMAGKNRVFV
jgi:diguanylate cyclase (GGDEF)-like protein